ncbi:hypothetical protein BKA65DRAFT_477559 [Rhexocercosporidium sp. MPI-PUGE-AT-0058]|nr:hypothetical protein BKA65DRAFT_477559 [Rhexocercosporidium sp. MPI-PUGE-AT-0058]
MSRQKRTWKDKTRAFDPNTKPTHSSVSVVALTMTWLCQIWSKTVAGWDLADIMARFTNGAFQPELFPVKGGDRNMLMPRMIHIQVADKGSWHVGATLPATGLLCSRRAFAANRIHRMTKSNSVKAAAIWAKT